MNEEDIEIIDQSLSKLNITNSIECKETNLFVDERTDYINDNIEGSRNEQTLFQSLRTYHFFDHYRGNKSKEEIMRFISDILTDMILNSNVSDFLRNECNDLKQENVELKMKLYEMKEKIIDINDITTEKKRCELKIKYLEENNEQLKNKLCNLVCELKNTNLHSKKDEEILVKDY